MNIEVGQLWQTNNMKILITDIQDVSGIFKRIWFKIPNAGKFSEWDLDIKLSEFIKMIEDQEIWLLK